VRKCDAAGRLCREERQVTVSRVAHSSELLIALCDLEEVSATVITVFAQKRFINRCATVTLTDVKQQVKCGNHLNFSKLVLQQQSL
jgi:hypothetical protein